MVALSITKKEETGMALIVSDARQNNGIHIDRIHISLNERPATKLEAEEPQKQTQNYSK